MGGTNFRAPQFGLAFLVANIGRVLHFSIGKAPWSPYNWFGYCISLFYSTACFVWVIAWVLYPKALRLDLIAQSFILALKQRFSLDLYLFRKMVPIGISHQFQSYNPLSNAGPTPF